MNRALIKKIIFPLKVSPIFWKMEVGPPKRTAFRGAASDNLVCRSVHLSYFSSKEKCTIGILILCPSLLFVLRSCLFSHSYLALQIFFLTVFIFFLFLFSVSLLSPCTLSTSLDRLFKPFLPTFLFPFTCFRLNIRLFSFYFNIQEPRDDYSQF